jgi:hypothetical protein
MKHASHLHTCNTTQAIKQENEVGNYLGMASGLGCGWCFWSRELSLGWHLDWDVEAAFLVGNYLYIVTTYGLGRGGCFHSRELPIHLEPHLDWDVDAAFCSRMKLISWDDIWIRIWIGMSIRGLSLVQRASERAGRCHFLLSRLRFRNSLLPQRQQLRTPQHHLRVFFFCLSRMLAALSAVSSIFLVSK